MKKTLAAICLTLTVSNTNAFNWGGLLTGVAQVAGGILTGIGGGGAPSDGGS